MTTKREFAYLAGGFGIGLYASKVGPKLKLVQSAKYFKEMVEARRRLQKILIEEYERIDDAITAEETFLALIDPRLKTSPKNIRFEVRDDGRDRHLSVHFDFNDPEDEVKK